MPSTVIVGCDKYPDPGFVTLTALILPLPIYATASAPDPPPPVILITGGSNYLLPGSAIFSDCNSNPTLSSQCLLGYFVTSEKPDTT